MMSAVKVTSGMRARSVSIAVMACDENGNTVTSIVKVKSGVFFITDGEYDYSYTIPYDASQLEVTISTNRDFEVKVDSDWITYVQTKAVEEKTLVFDVDENEGAIRFANIQLSSGEREYEISVKQYGATIVQTEVVFDDVNKSVMLDVSQLKTAKGQTIAQAMGYNSWDELSSAIGPYETAMKFAGDVKITGFNPNTNEYYGEVPYTHSIGYNIDWYGQLSEWTDVLCWNVGGFYESGPTQHFWINYNRDDIYLDGEITFGILFSSDDAEVPVVVNVRFEEYQDPEKGMYDNPADPGEYTFDLEYEFDVNNLNWSNNYVSHDAALEFIKQTFGLTSYETYKASEREGR